MHPAKHPTVLVADSYEDTRFMLKYWLEAEGYGVQTAAGGWLKPGLQTPSLHTVGSLLRWRFLK